MSNVGIVRKSNIKKAGRGVFASRNYKKGDIIEVCPFIIENNYDTIKDSIINDYIWDHDIDNNKSIIVFGLCSMYNHESDSNVEGEQDIKNNNMIFRSIKNIKKGEEMTHDYGENYWNTRNN